MRQYAEQNAERVIVLLKQDDGTYAAPVSDDGDPMQTLVRRFGRADEATEVTATLSGDNTIFTPVSGLALRLKWIYLATAKDVPPVVAIIKLGAHVEYTIPMTSPGIFARTSIREGGVDEPLVVNLSAASTVYVNYELEEF